MITDPIVEGCGGNRFNIAPVVNDVEVIEHSIDHPEVRKAIGRGEVIFNLAGEISHIHSQLLPERDLEMNTLAQLRFLQACAEVNPGVRIVYAGTRQVYGIPEYLPVDEKHPVNPVDFNGVHKYAATMYHLMLSRAGRIDAVVIRLTNVYGSRMALDVPCQGFLSTYLRLALTGQTLEIFGDGRQLRDPLYVDDAVEAMILAGFTPTLRSRSYNIGGPEALTLAKIATLTSAAASGPAPVFREFPEDRKAIDIGSYHTDSTLVRRHLGWKASLRFEDGIARTISYYRQHLDRYLDPSNPNPNCRLKHPSHPAPRLPAAV